MSKPESWGVVLSFHFALQNWSLTLLPCHVWVIVEIHSPLDSVSNRAPPSPNPPFPPLRKCRYEFDMMAKLTMAYWQKTDKKRIKKKSIPAPQKLPQSKCFCRKLNRYLVRMTGRPHNISFLPCLASSHWLNHFSPLQLQTSIGESTHVQLRHS